MNSILLNLEKTTWTTDELISLTKQHWQRGEFQKVETICNDLLRQAQGQEANVFWVVGLISYEIAQPTMAIKYLSESLHREATPEKYRILATVHFDFKQFDLAFSCLRKALELQPAVEEGEKIFLLLLNCREYVQDFLAWRELGLFYLKAQHHSHYKAFYCFRKSLDIQPDSAEVYSLLVEAAKGNGEFYAHFSSQPVDKEDTQGLADLYFTALLGTPQHPTVSYHPQEPSWAELGGIYLYIQRYEIAYYFMGKSTHRKAKIANRQQMKRFFVYTRGRTGSSALVDDLNQHPQIVCHQELLAENENFIAGPSRENCYSLWMNKVNNPSIEAYWEYLDVLASTAGASINGMKILLNQFEERKPDGIEKAVWNTDVKIIYLVRDPVCEAVSLMLSETRNLYNLQYGDKQEIKRWTSLKSVCLDPKRIDREIDHIIDCFKKQTDLFKIITNPILMITYEKYFGDRETTYQEILDFLQVCSVLPPQDNGFIKVTSPGWKNDVENIDEILRYLESRGRDLSVAYSFITSKH